MPFLQKISIDPARTDIIGYPFNLPLFEGGIEINITSNVTFFVGENGSGKSTILEGIAQYCGFNLAGGSKNHRFDNQDIQTLSTIMRLSWQPRVSDGFFMRAESFYNFASFIDELTNGNPAFLDAYGGKSLHHQSHGESFFSIFYNRFSKGIYILDEPEAALSPSKQFEFMVLISELEKAGQAQFIIASHSPILLCYPNATIFSVEKGLPKIKYQDTHHFQFAKSFLNDPENYLRFMKP